MADGTIGHDVSPDAAGMPTAEGNVGQAQDSSCADPHVSAALDVHDLVPPGTETVGRRWRRTKAIMSFAALHIPSAVKMVTRS